MQFFGGVFEVADEGFFNQCLVYALWANACQAVDLVVTQYLGVGDGQIDPGAKFFDTVRQAGNPALAFGPVARGQVEQHLGQFVGIQLGLDFGRAVVVRKQVFNVNSMDRLAAKRGMVDSCNFGVPSPRGRGARLNVNRASK